MMSFILEWPSKIMIILKKKFDFAKSNYILALFFVIAYSYENQIKVLNSKNFYTSVTVSNKFWIIIFYSSQSRYFNEYAQEWLKVAKALETVDGVKIGWIDGATEKSLIKKIGVESTKTFKFKILVEKIEKKIIEKGFPQIKFYGRSKYYPKKYTGLINSQSIVKQIISELRIDSLINRKLIFNKSKQL